MSSEPRLKGHRITILTVVSFVEDFESILNAARELRISEADLGQAFNQLVSDGFCFLFSFKSSE